MYFVLDETQIAIIIEALMQEDTQESYDLISNLERQLQKCK
jgi:hypothetical protein